MKKIKPVLISLVFIVVLFFLSYGVSYKVKSSKLAKPISDVPVVNNETTTLTPADTSEQYTDSQQNTFSDGGQNGELSSIPEPIIVNMPSDSTWSLVLLNAFYKMNSTYEPKVTKVCESPVIYLEERVAEQYNKMAEAASAQGLTLPLASGYVSIDRQDRKYEAAVQDFTDEGYTDEQAQLKALYNVLPAYQSETNYGLSVDIGWLSDDFKNSPAYAWLKDNAADYGFIERYPSDKTQITHFAAQPWHWRYVGVDYAKEMVSKGKCLEEYVGKVN